MEYFHSFWTRPYFKSADEQASKDIELWEFEALTWLVSILEIRRHSRIGLITDSRGLEFVKRTGLFEFYNGRVSTPLDDIPPDINPTVFWAAGKLYAWREVQPPCCSLDTDAVLWEPLPQVRPVTTLHSEDNRWSIYASNREEFGQFGFEESEWSWQLPVCNTGVAYFEDSKPMRYYSDTAIRFMIDYSRWLKSGDHGESMEGNRNNRAMIFAEQRLLAMCLERMRMRPSFLVRLNKQRSCIAFNRAVMHLWRSKVSYKYCAAARSNYIRALVERVQAHDSDAAPLLKRWGINDIGSKDLMGELNWRERPPFGNPKHFYLIDHTGGPIVAIDPHVGKRRKLKNGSIVLPGEIVKTTATTKPRMTRLSEHI